MVTPLRRPLGGTTPGRGPVPPWAGADDLDLKLVRIFEGVPAELLELVTPTLIWFYQHDEVICSHGDAADSLIILLHGQARIVADGI